MENYEVDEFFADVIASAMGLAISFLLYVVCCVAVIGCSKPDSGSALAEKVASCPSGGEAKAAVSFSGDALAITLKARDEPAVLVMLERAGDGYVYDSGGAALGVTGATAMRGTCSDLCSGLVGECVRAVLTSTDLCVAAMGPVCRRVGP